MNPTDLSGVAAPAIVLRAAGCPGPGRIQASESSSGLVVVAHMIDNGLQPCGHRIEVAISSGGSMAVWRDQRPADLGDLALMSRRFPPPWSVDETDACFIVRDANGHGIASQARARWTNASILPGRRSRENRTCLRDVAYQQMPGRANRL